MPPATKKHRFKPGTVALREIRKAQKDTSIFFAQAPVIRYYKFLMQKAYVTRLGYSAKNVPSIKVKAEAIFNINYLLQHHLVGLFEYGNKCAIHAKRVTLMRKDLQLLKDLNIIKT